MEKAAAYCVRAGLHADCNKEAGRADLVRSAEVLNLEIFLGAARAKDLIENILKDWDVMRYDEWGVWKGVVLY